MPKRFRVGERTYNIPDEKIGAFLGTYPNAKEIPSLGEAIKSSLAPSRESFVKAQSGIPGAQGQMMTEVAGEAWSTLSKLLYSGIKSQTSDETFSEALSKKTELGRLVLGDEGNAAGKLALDILGDPANVVAGGVGVARKLMKGGKALKGTTALEGVIKQARAETEDITMGPVKELINLLEGQPRRLTKQRMSYAKERAGLFNQIEKESASLSGKDVYDKAKGVLKSHGELEKLDFPQLKISESGEKQLYNMINKSDLRLGDKLTAWREMETILGRRGGKVPTKSGLKVLEKVFPRELIDTLEKKRPWEDVAKGVAGNILNFPRAMRATADLSAPLRQGIFMIRRQRQFAPAFKDMFKYAFSEKSYDDFMESLTKRPTYHLMKEHKLSLTDLSADLTKREEQIMSNLPERIPGFGKLARGSNRAYTGFLNQLRADVFDDLVAKAEKLGVMDNNTLKGITNYINAATGRGRLGVFEESAKILNGTLFSPRLIASRVEIMGKLFNPKMYTKKNAFLRKEYLKDLLGFLGTGSTVLSLANMGGAEVSLDPRSADFGKVKIGKTRFDVWGGFQQYAVLLSRIITSKSVSSTTGREYKIGEGDYKPTTRADLVARAGEFKLAPQSAYLWNAFRGKTAIGDKFRAGPEAINLFLPIIAEDISDLVAQGEVTDIPKVIPAVFGVGVQTYGDRVPFPAKTPAGRETVKWRFEPTLGEKIYNMATGKKITSFTEQEQQELRLKREAEIQRNIAVDKAKERVKKTGDPEQVGDTYIYRDKDGILKTRRKKKRNTESLKQLLENF